MIHTRDTLCKYDFGPSEIFMSHLEPCDTKVSSPTALVGPETEVSKLSDLSPA